MSLLLTIMGGWRRFVWICGWVGLGVVARSAKVVYTLPLPKKNTTVKRFDKTLTTRIARLRIFNKEGER